MLERQFKTEEVLSAATGKGLGPSVDPRRVVEHVLSEIPKSITNKMRYEDIYYSASYSLNKNNPELGKESLNVINNQTKVTKEWADEKKRGLGDTMEVKPMSKEDLKEYLTIRKESKFELASPEFEKELLSNATGTVMENTRKFRTEEVLSAATGRGLGPTVDPRLVGNYMYSELPAEIKEKMDLHDDYNSVAYALNKQNPEIAKAAQKDFNKDTMASWIEEQKRNLGETVEIKPMSVEDAKEYLEIKKNSKKRFKVEEFLKEVIQKGSEHNTQKLTKPSQVAEVDYRKAKKYKNVANSIDLKLEKQGIDYGSLYNDLSKDLDPLKKHRDQFEAKRQEVENDLNKHKLETVSKSL